MSSQPPKIQKSRRTFLSLSAKGLIGTGLALSTLRREGSTFTFQEKSSPAKEMPYRTLGRTGLKVSELGLGASKITDPMVIHMALDKGINYVDTAPVYLRGKSEETVGKVLKTRRKEVVLATKLYPVDRRSKEKNPVETMVKCCEDSLQRLQTDVIDLMQLHAIDSPGISQYDTVKEALEKLKKAGKVRFFGLSSHNSGTYPEVMTEAIESGFYDTILIAYNYLMKDFPAVQKLIKLAAEKNIGFVVMKANYWPMVKPKVAFSRNEGETNKLKKEVEEKEKAFLKGKPGTIYQENIKWILSHKEVSTVISNMKTVEILNQNSVAPGERFSFSGKRLLEERAMEMQREACRFCQKCLPCPNGVAIPDILRFSTYFKYYGEPEKALQANRSLSPAARAHRCRGCGECERKCPFSLRIREQIAEARRLLV